MRLFHAKLAILARTSRGSAAAKTLISWFAIRLSFGLGEHILLHAFNQRWPARRANLHQTAGRVSERARSCHPGPRSKDGLRRRRSASPLPLPDSGAASPNSRRSGQGSGGNSGHGNQWDRPSRLGRASRHLFNARYQAIYDANLADQAQGERG